MTGLPIKSSSIQRISRSSASSASVHRMSFSTGGAGSLDADSDDRVQCHYVQLVPSSKRQKQLEEEEEEEEGINKELEEEEEEEEEAMCCSSTHAGLIWQTSVKGRTSSVHPLLMSRGLLRTSDFVERKSQNPFLT